MRYLSHITNEQVEEAFSKGWGPAEVLSLKRACTAWCKLPDSHQAAHTIDIRADVALVDDRWIVYRDWSNLQFPSSPLHETNIYTDGSGTSKNSPAGIGIVIFGATAIPPQVCSFGAGEGTNNYAELMAIRRGLYSFPDARSKIMVHSDSEYALGAVDRARNWATNVNGRLIEAIRTEIDWRRKFGFIALAHVDGHSGNIWNELADVAAKAGRKREQMVIPKKMLAYLKESKIGLTMYWDVLPARTIGG